MARTKASVGAKISSGKSSKARCCAAPTVTVSSAGGSDKSRATSGGGNPMCQRETPTWQKPITNFFVCKDKDDRNSDTEDNGITAGSSKPKRNIIHSDDEEDNQTDKELDVTIELEPLTGDNSHKIDEYYSKNGKGKGVGKKSKGKENVDSNERRSSKRDLDDVETSDSKRVKL